MSIEVKNVFSLYAKNTPLEVEALKDVSFYINDGEFVGIMGHTGCGKTTLIQLIAGLLKPSDGQILIDNAGINDGNYDRTILRETVGIVFQYPEYQLFETTVEKDVAFTLKHRGLSKSEIKERVKWALELMGFSYDNIRKKSPLSLSGGEKRRVAIAGVLAGKPNILILDEPIAGLDPYGRREFLEIIAKLNREGTTVLMVSHNIDCLSEYAQRILVLNGGELVADGTPDEVFGDFYNSDKLQIGMGDVQYIARGLYEKGIISSPVITKYNALFDEIKNSLKGGDDV